MAQLCAVLGHAAARAAVHVAGVADVAAVVLLLACHPAAAAAAVRLPPPPLTSPEMVETGKLLGGYQAKLQSRCNRHTQTSLKTKVTSFQARESLKTER